MSLLDCTPNEPGYWQEPALPYCAQLPKQELAALHYFTLLDDLMGPRFQQGSVVASQCVHGGQQNLVPGVYIAVWLDEDSQLTQYVGRLQEATEQCLVLQHDKTGAVFCWPWKNASLQLYRVTHYCQRVVC